MKYTENYNLPLYEPNDLANLMDGYNESMNTLDDVMKTNIDIVDDYTGTVAQNKADIAANKKILDAEIARATERENELNTLIFNTKNPIYYGADPTGVNDSSTAINDCINANKGGVIKFTTGVYKCLAPIETPYSTNSRVAIDFNNSKLIFSDEKVHEYALGIGYKDSTSIASSEESDNFYSIFSNFTIIANDNYKSVVNINNWYKACVIRDFKIICNTIGVIAGGSSKPSDTRLLNGFLFAKSAKKGTVGIYSKGTDNQYSQLRVYNFETGFITKGGDRIENAHILATDVSNIDNTVGIFNDGEIQISNIYLDTLKKGIEITGASGFLGVNIYSYSWSEDLKNRILFYYDDDCLNNKVCASNIYVQTKDYEANYPVKTVRRVFYNDDTANFINLENITYTGPNKALAEYDYIKQVRNNLIKCYTLTAANTWNKICNFISSPSNTVGLIIANNETAAYANFRISNTLNISNNGYLLNTSTSHLGVGISCNIEDGFVVGSIFVKNSTKNLPNITILSTEKYFNLLTLSPYMTNGVAETPDNIIFEQ